MNNWFGPLRFGPSLLMVTMVATAATAAHDWQFRVDDARIKLKSLYSKIET